MTNYTTDHIHKDVAKLNKLQIWIPMKYSWIIYFLKTKFTGNVMRIIYENERLSIH